jgi:hypothetical protein
MRFTLTLQTPERNFSNAYKMQQTRFIPHVGCSDASEHVFMSVEGISSIRCKMYNKQILSKWSISHFRYAGILYPSNFTLCNFLKNHFRSYVQRNVLSRVYVMKLPCNFWHNIYKHSVFRAGTLIRKTALTYSVISIIQFTFMKDSNYSNWIGLAEDVTLHLVKQFQNTPCPGISVTSAPGICYRTTETEGMIMCLHGSLQFPLHTERLAAFMRIN